VLPASVAVGTKFSMGGDLLNSWTGDELPSSKHRIAYVIDDDRGVRVAITLLLRSIGAECRAFASADDFLSALVHLAPGCAIIDVRMPDKDGVALLGELAERGCDWPAIVMTGHAEVRTAVKAMKLGAIEFLEKPFGDEELLAALERGWTALAAAAETDGRTHDARRRLTGLTTRERCILDGIIGGLSNKEMAIALGLSHRTVEMHRSSLMRRTRARKVADLISLAATAGYEKAAGPSPLRLHAE